MLIWRLKGSPLPAGVVKGKEARLSTIGTVSEHVIRRYFPAEACQFTRTLIEERSG